MQKLLVLTTGGTIDKVYFDALSQFEVGDPVARDILMAMNVAFEFEVTEICRKDSLEITEQDRQSLRDVIEASDANYILITHGTDTMVDTAQFIGEQTEKRIVLTGSMQPAAFKDTDAVFNIGSAIGALSIALPGVYIAMSGKVYPAGEVFKNYDSKRFEQFQDSNSVQ